MNIWLNSRICRSASRRVTLGLSKNPAAVNIRIFNPLYYPFRFCHSVGGCAALQMLIFSSAGLQILRSGAGHRAGTGPAPHPARIIARIPAEAPVMKDMKDVKDRYITFV